eukprot:2162386-Amphidinium_carterae.1
MATGWSHSGKSPPAYSPGLLPEGLKLQVRYGHSRSETSMQSSSTMATCKGPTHMSTPRAKRWAQEPSDPRTLQDGAVMTWPESTSFLLEQC